MKVVQRAPPSNGLARICKGNGEVKGLSGKTKRPGHLSYTDTIQQARVDMSLKHTITNLMSGSRLRCDNGGFRNDIS